MKKFILRFAAKDEKTFDTVRKGTKSVETKAATRKYREVKAGDVLILTCGKQKIEKKVLRARHFKTIESLFQAIPLRKVNPFAKSIKEARGTYYAYAGYREKIRRVGLMAFDLGKK